MNHLFLIAGPCAIEDEQIPRLIAKKVKDLADQLEIPFVFKASYRKANRTRLDSFVGLPRTVALEILRSIKEEFDVPVLTDVHESWECDEVAEYVDYLQIPAFLCRQTDLLLAAANTGKGINIKKGQFLSPEAVEFILEKIHSTGNSCIWLTERGSSFGYESLIVDMTGIPRMKKFGFPVVVDCTHSVQKPNQRSGVTGGDATQIETLALASVAAGADGLFIEVHPSPNHAKSDAASMLSLEKLEPLIAKAKKIFDLRKEEQ